MRMSTFETMKTSIFVVLLAACSVHCNVTSTCNQEDVCQSYLDVAIDMISKAKDNMPRCKTYTESQLKKAADCADIFDMGQNKSGVYEIWPMNRIFGGKSVSVYCDMDTDGGGWTVIQRRGDFKNPKDYFFRNWENYKEGFGNIKEDFWLGNDKIFALTNQNLYSVRFDLKDSEKNKRYAVYDKFWIDGEEWKYTLHISLYNGNAGDSMAYSNNQRFSTFDKINLNNCSNMDKGGWWYILSHDRDKCHDANLNGLYHKGKFKPGHKDGITWKTWKGFDDSLESTEIKIRPKHFRAAFS